MQLGNYFLYTLKNERLEHLKITLVWRGKSSSKPLVFGFNMLSFQCVLVGGFNPSGKIWSNWIISPDWGNKKKQISEITTYSSLFMLHDGSHSSELSPFSNFHNKMPQDSSTTWHEGTWIFTTNVWTTSPLHHPQNKRHSLKLTNIAPAK